MLLPPRINPDKPNLSTHRALLPYLGLSCLISWHVRDLHWKWDDIPLKIFANRNIIGHSLYPVNMRAMQIMLQ